ncbi:hypothetical protein NDU88_000498 [Pleurodeles waltl]|uniref:Uncharacterized protein n=1 Tax=Pleurodeles waltl TaxID=8319 RepID=A0AAV7LD84_PLEWA|nr:hypothetical protein NDU88_000498 [Pleurodeles waltl]
MHGPWPPLGCGPLGRGRYYFTVSGSGGSEKGRMGIRDRSSPRGVPLKGLGWLGTDPASQGPAPAGGPPQLPGAPWLTPGLVSTRRVESVLRPCQRRARCARLRSTAHWCTGHRSTGHSAPVTASSLTA